MPKLKPAKIFGCRFMGKIGRFYTYWPSGTGRNPLGGVWKFKIFPTKSRVRELYKNVVGIKDLVR